LPHVEDGEVEAENLERADDGLHVAFREPRGADSGERVVEES